ncbi:MAG: hypothetical protein K2K18_01330, partial [Malacoplasma sp.]|nr:hypothetical protein [Malacoplasma sp.]
IINSSEYRNKHIIGILEDYKKQFAYKRKTLIENEVEDLDVETADIVEEIHGTCIVTRDNYIKFIGEDIEEFDLSKTKIKDADIPVDMFKMSTLDYLVCLTNRGKVITIPAYKIKMSKLKDNGVHINELITIDSFEKTILAFAVSKNANIDTQILIATRNSFIKRITLEYLSLARTAKYLSLISLKTSDDEVVSAYVLKPEHKELISVTENGFATKYDIEEIPIVGRAASGVKNMSLKDKDCIGFVVPIPKNENFLFFVSNRGAKRIHINDIVLTSRSKLGKRIFQQTESNPYLVNSGFVVSGRNTIYLLLENNEIVPLKVSEIPISDNESRMNLITKIGKNLIVSSSCLDIEKSIIELSQTNNFNTLSEEKQNRIETKEKETSVKENEEEKESKTFSKPKKSYFINEDSLELEEKSNEEEYENDIEENQDQELDENKQEESKNDFIVSEQTNLEDDEVKEDYKDFSHNEKEEDYVESNSYKSNLENEKFDDDYENNFNETEIQNENNNPVADKSNYVEDEKSSKNFDDESDEFNQENSKDELNQDFDELDESNNSIQNDENNFEQNLEEDEELDEQDSSDEYQNQDLEEIENKLENDSDIDLQQDQQNDSDDDNDFSIDDINDIEEDDWDDYDEEDDEDLDDEENN